MLITKEVEIDMGHRVTNHKSKCASLHGHRYKIEVGVDDQIITTEGSSSEGMVMDFGDLKEVMMDVLDKRYDHGMVMWIRDPLANIIASDPKTKSELVHFIPTAENLAKYWFDLLKVRLEERSIKIKHIKVWETPTSTATYGEVS